MLFKLRQPWLPEPDPSPWVGVGVLDKERLVHVAVPVKGSPQRSEEQLQVHRAMSLSRALPPGRGPAALSAPHVELEQVGSKAGDEQWLTGKAYITTQKA
ncbi:hypothetical protein PKOR_21310 [Pontibacter korlensis]|uniref:Uncharacterized protein n=1 Tax=Pontibacter korlensis TaxID=400092 RepID=A0A0E3ZI38_9BACT|nr:hypothetical protein PKOR_21310 [Pontibacter korlensis]